LSTVLVTNMPFWAERAGVPRTLAVEFPFGHTLGQPHDVAQQVRVIRQALEVLETVETPGTIVHSEEAWPVPQKQALEDWQPSAPSPLMKVMAPRFMQMMREQRRRSKATNP
jgi:hypothetical protein